MAWSEFNAFEGFLKTMFTVGKWQVLAYHECEPSPYDKYHGSEVRANGMVLAWDGEHMLWKPLYSGVVGRRYFKDGTKRMYID